MPTFATPTPPAIVIDIAVGEITLVASDRPDTAITIEPGDALDNLSVQVAQATRAEFGHGTVTVEQRMPWYRSYDADASGSLVSVHIEAPVGCTLSANVALGSVTASGMIGDCTIAISNGPVRLDAVDGFLRLKGSNGHVSVGMVEGDVDVQTSNGSITVGELASGTVALSTSLGSIDVGIRPGVAANLDLKTKLGTVHNELDRLPLAAVENAQATVQVRARTKLADIVVRRAQVLPAGA